MADYGTFKRGRKEFPLSTGSSESLLHDADPFLFYALDFFAKVIETHVGDRLMQAAGDIPELTEAVAYKVPLDPMPWLQTTHFKFPLLAVYRTRGRLEERTVAWRHSVTTFEVIYVLPPLTAADAEQVYPILSAISDVIDDRADLGYDPSFTPLGAPVNDSFWVELAGVEKVTFKETEFGLIPWAEGLAMASLRMRGEVSERQDTPTGFQTFNGVDATVSVASGDEDPVDVVVLATEPAPTITAVAPTSGTYAGNVAVTITGTNFKAPAGVFFDGKAASSVVVVNATTITCRTPAFEAYDATRPLTVHVKTDWGFSAPLVDAFTLT